MRKQVPANAFWLAEPGHRPRFVDSGGNVCEDSTAAFYALVEGLSVELDKREYSSPSLRKVMPPLIPDLHEFYPRGIQASIRTAEPRIQKLLNELFTRVQQSIVAAHERGIERGKNLLVQLAGGALTVGDFNDTVTKGPEV